MCSAQGGLGFGIGEILYFDTGTSILTKEHKKILEGYCKGREDRNWELGLMGYSDTIGKPHYNDTLSIKRARAVRDYIQKLAPKAKLYTYIGQRDSLHLALPLNEQRKVELIYGLLCGTDMDGYKTLGTEGIFGEGFLAKQNSSTDNYGSYLKVTPYVTAKQMIAGQKNGIDTTGTILRVATIATICVNDGWVAPGGYKVYVPVRINPEKDLKVYLNDAAPKQPERWKPTDIKIAIKGGYYVFYLNSLTGCTTICLGKPTVPLFVNKPVKDNSYKVIYIAAHKPFNFTDVTAGSKTTQLKYSAKINDTVIAFTIPAKLSAKHMLFEGFYMEVGKQSQITVPLKDCVFTKDTNGNEHYYICKECIKVNGSARKKGFWAWVKRTLGMS